MKFSIIVPVYNIEDKIQKCLSSIENQSFSDFEVLVIIDGATDESKAICDKFEQRDNRFKVRYKENGGLVSARKYGAKIALGEYIINIDGDDYVEKDYLMEANSIIERYCPDTIAFGYKEVASKITKCKNVSADGLYEKEKLLSIKKFIIYDSNLKGFQGGSLINTIWTKVVKREIYQKCQTLIPNHITVGEDLLLNAYLMDEISSLYVTNKTFYNYVVYASSMMHSCNVENFKHYLNVARELNKIYYICENDINVYVFQAYISEIRKVAKYSKDYNEFEEIMNKCEKEVSELREYARRAKVERYNFEFFVKHILVKLSNRSLMYFVCKYS